MVPSPGRGGRAGTVWRVDHLRPGNGIVVPVGDVDWSFTPSGGPGGQHANRSNTRVEARLDLRTAGGIGDRERERLRARLGDEVRVTVDEARSQHRNRVLALERLEERLRQALAQPRRRRATAPSAGAKRRRVESKRRRSSVKRLRGRPRLDD